MKSGKALRTGGIPIEVRKCLGGVGVSWLKLMSHTIKLREGVIKHRSWMVTTVSDNQF